MRRVAPPMLSTLLLAACCLVLCAPACAQRKFNATEPRTAPPGGFARVDLATIEATWPGVAATRKALTYPVSHDELYELINWRPYAGLETSVYRMFPTFDVTPPTTTRWKKSNTRREHVLKVLELTLGIVDLAVEVGCFHGHSTILQAEILKEARQQGLLYSKRAAPNTDTGVTELQLQTKPPVFLCIDPFVGTLGLMFKGANHVAGGQREGRSDSYDQYMANVHEALRTGQVEERSVLTLPTTGTIGARWLTALGLIVDMLYLDCAHEQGEVMLELQLYWPLIRKGGVLWGDDLTWVTVRNDVITFANWANSSLEVLDDGTTWIMHKQY